MESEAKVDVGGKDVGGTDVNELVNISDLNLNINNEIVCAICLANVENGIGNDEDVDDLKSRLITSCGHNFHKGCIQKWCLKKNICPCCRLDNVLDLSMVMVEDNFGELSISVPTWSDIIFTSPLYSFGYTPGTATTEGGSSNPRQGMINGFSDFSEANYDLSGIRMYNEYVHYNNSLYIS
jgi:hypothetical protein